MTKNKHRALTSNSIGLDDHLSKRIFDTKFKFLVGQRKLSIRKYLFFMIKSAFPDLYDSFGTIQGLYRYSHANRSPQITFLFFSSLNLKAILEGLKAYLLRSIADSAHALSI